MNKIAFIGVGIMGRSMVRNLMKAGFELHIYARTRSKVEDVISEGATFHDTIADCVKDAEAVITIVGFPTDVEEVYFDAGNILESAKEGTYLIDMTTTSPMLDQKIAEEGTKRGFHVLDAPVTGGDTGARTVHSPSWSAVPEKTTKPACRYSRRWEPTSTTREDPVAASTPSLRTRS